MARCWLVRWVGKLDWISPVITSTRGLCVAIIKCIPGCSAHLCQAHHQGLYVRISAFISSSMSIDSSISASESLSQSLDGYRYFTISPLSSLGSILFLFARLFSSLYIHALVRDRWSNPMLFLRFSSIRVRNWSMTTHITYCIFSVLFCTFPPKTHLCYYFIIIFLMCPAWVYFPSLLYRNTHCFVSVINDHFTSSYSHKTFLLSKCLFFKCS